MSPFRFKGALRMKTKQAHSFLPCNSSGGRPLLETARSLGLGGLRPSCAERLEALWREETLGSQPLQEEAARKEAVLPTLYLLTTTSIPFALTYVIRMLWPLLLQYLG